jgi:tetratricopeptide (TPR) repeat protein
VEAVAGDPRAGGGWAALVRRTAARLTAEHHRPAAVALAWQCWQLGDQHLAERLLSDALRGADDAGERLDTSLAAVECLWANDRPQPAARVLDRLLSEPGAADHPALWRLGAVLATESRRPARALACLERAVDLEFRHAPEVIDLAAVRTDFGQLLAYYLRLTEALALLEQPRPADLTARVVRAVDRWRTLDPDNPVICPLAARVLHRLGESELAWEYLNTPVAVFPPDSESWKEFAEALVRAEDHDLAEQAYAQAERADPTDAELVWVRAQNLERAGRRDAARAVYRRLADGRWDPQFRGVRERARRRLREQ